MRFVAGLVLLGHAFAHLAIWLPAYDPDRHAFDAKRSLVLTNAGVDQRGARRAAAAAAIVVWGVFVVAGFATMREATWAGEVTVGAASLSILLAAVYFHPWLLVLVVIDLAIIYLAL